MISGLDHPELFRMNAALRARESRPFGLYPDDGPTIALDHAVGLLRDSLDSASEAILKENAAAAAHGLGSALQALHTPSRDTPNSVVGPSGTPTLEEIVAPLHSWMPEDMSREVLARITFSFAEVAAGEASQRKVLHYLDLLIDELPDPLKGEKTTARQRLLRMLAHIYMGRSLAKSRTIQEAIKQYETALEINDLHEEGIEGARFRAYVELIDLRFTRAFKLLDDGKFRRALGEVKKVLALRDGVESRIPLEREEYKNGMILLRQEIGRRLWDVGLVGMAYNELQGISERYGSEAGADTLMKIIDGAKLSDARKAKLRAHLFAADGSLKDPSALGELPLSTKAAIFLTHTLKNARRYSSFNTFVTWLAGATAFAGAAFAATSGDAEFADLLAASGAGAAITDGAVRIYNGAQSLETKQAQRVGLNDIPVGRTLAHATAFAGKSLVPYVLFGGEIPALGAISDVPAIGGIVEAHQGSALASGSLNGLGTLVDGFVAGLSSEFQTALAAVADTGSAGLTTYGGHVAQTTLGSTVGSAIDTYSSGVRSVFDGSFFASVADTARGIVGGTPPEMALDAYKVSSLGYYAASRFSKTFRKTFNWMGPAFVPGGLLLFADMGEALGANSHPLELGPITLPINNLVGTAAVGSGYQILGQTLIGNRSFKDIQWYNVIGAAGIINAYVGTSANFDPIVKSETFGQIVAESVGRQIGMLPIIVVHGGALMVDNKRFAQNKLARLVVTDNFSNSVRIALGEWEGFGPVLAGVSIGFFLTNSLLGRTFNDLAGSKPAALSFEGMLEKAGGHADEGVLKSLARSLRRIPPAAPITKMSSSTLTLPFRVFYQSLRGDKLGDYMIPEEKTYAMIHDALVEGRLSEKQVGTLISATEQFLGRPDDTDVARGLTFILASTQDGHYSKAVKPFLRRNRDVHGRLRIPKDPFELPKRRAAKEAEIWRHLRHPYRVCPENGMAPLVRTSIAPRMAAGVMPPALVTRVPVVPSAI